MSFFILQKFNLNLKLWEEIRYFTSLEYDTALLYLDAYRKKYSNIRYRLVGVYDV